jgi:RND family efflux transporter MFP subunit
LHRRLIDSEGDFRVNKWAKRGLAFVIGGGLVFLGGWRIYEIQQEQAGPGAKKKKTAGARVVTVDLAESRVGQVREELLLTGALKPKDTVNVTPQATGRVQQLHFDVGDLVQSGVLIAELDDDELQQQVNRAEAAIGVTTASLTQREAEYHNAQATLKRSEDLFKDGLISPQEFEQQKTSVAVFEAQMNLAKAQQTQAEAELRELRIRLDQTKIYSPMTGAVSQRYVDVGALVNPNTPVIQVVNLSTMVTQGNVPERNIGKLRIGNIAIVSVDAIPEQPFNGRVARISPVLDAATRSALIEIDIPNPDRVLKAEMFARIRLDLGSMREATLIPRDGLVYRGQQPGVYVVEGDRPVFRPIETGMTREDQVEVLANLPAGTQIVGRGATMLREGDRIKAAAAGETVGREQGTRSGSETQRSAKNEPPAQAAGGSPTGSNH